MKVLILFIVIGYLSISTLVFRKMDSALLQDTDEQSEQFRYVYENASWWKRRSMDVTIILIAMLWPLYAVHSLTRHSS